MFRTKTLIIMTALMVSVLMPATIFAESETITYGTAIVQDDQATNDSIVINMSGVAPAADGTAYNAVLVSASGTSSLNLGEVTVVQPVIHGVIQETGNINFTFDSNSTGYDGSDLLASYSRIKLTNGSGGDTAYSDNVPADAAAYVNLIIADLNSLDGLLTSALDGAVYAQASADIAEIKTSISNAMANVGEVTTLTDQIAANAAAAVEADAEDSNLAEGSAGVVATAGNIAAWLKAAKETADTDVAEQTNATVANIFVGKIVNELSAAKSGWDSNTDGTISSTTGEGGSAQARLSTQQMATLTFEAKDLPGSETSTVIVGGASGSVLGLGLPSVGEKLIVDLLLMGVALGIVMLGAGSLILVRNRT